MPSFPDLRDDEQVVAPHGPAGPVAPADVLERVKTEGLRRRNRRHRRNAVIAAFGIAIVAMPAIALLPDDGSDDLTVASGGDADADVDSPGTTAARRPVTTVVEELPATSVVTVPTDDAPVVTTIPSQGPVTTVPPQAPACRNSSDPACGEFRWDPAPAANQALTGTITASNTNPAVGEEVVFTVTWSDPDSRELVMDFFSPEGVHLAGSCAYEQRHGPWTPPPAEAGSGTLTFRHTYTEADAGQVRTAAMSLATADVCQGPYGSELHLDLPIQVQPLP